MNLAIKYSTVFQDNDGWIQALSREAALPVDQSTAVAPEKLSYQMFLEGMLIRAAVAPN